jgi:hypothetical protein
MDAVSTFRVKLEAYRTEKPRRERRMQKSKRCRRLGGVVEGHSPDFESIKQTNPYGAEYWSARDLAPLLGYSNWQNFQVAIKRGQTACEQVDQTVSDHFTCASKKVGLGSGAQSEVQE